MKPDLCGVREGRHARAAGRPGQACAEKQVLRESDHPALRTCDVILFCANPSAYRAIRCNSTSKIKKKMT
jgi:hypothetical protein